MAGNPLYLLYYGDLEPKENSRIKTIIGIITITDSGSSYCKNKCELYLLINFVKTLETAFEFRQSRHCS